MLDPTDQGASMESSRLIGGASASSGFLEAWVKNGFNGCGIHWGYHMGYKKGYSMGHIYMYICIYMYIYICVYICIYIYNQHDMIVGCV